MDTRQVEAALAVARHLSFSGAAQELFLAQSSVSRQVAALERHLGGPLFHRTPSGVRLTALGEWFMPRGRAVLDAVAEAEGCVPAAVPGQRLPAPARARVR